MTGIQKRDTFHPRFGGETRRFLKSLRLFCFALMGPPIFMISASAAQAEADNQVVSALAAPPAEDVDFDSAMKALNFDPETVDFNSDASQQPNGMPDADEMSLVAAVLARSDLDLRKVGGIDHAKTLKAFLAARASARHDLRLLLGQWPTAADVAAGYAMLGAKSFAAYSAMSAGFGAPLESDYSSAIALSDYFSAEGDADGDGASNRLEYAAFIGSGRDAFIRAALDPATKPGADVKLPAVSAAKRLNVGVILYPGYELLDVFGPVEMWSYVREFNVIMIAEKAGPVKSGQGVETIATYSFADAPKLDIVMVPGGFGTRTQLENESLMKFLREKDAETTLTTSVCTGSALLAKAGLLSGRRATSNKAVFSLATDQDPTAIWIGKARWVEDGKYVTSSGVSAGTDMALGVVARLFGKERAERLARSVEYEWRSDPDEDPFAISLR